MFRLWETEELKSAIREIEQQLVDSTWSVSYAGGGFVQNVSPGDATKTLQSLYDELGTRSGYRHLARNTGRILYYRIKD